MFSASSPHFDPLDPCTRLTPNNGVIVQLGFVEHWLKISPIRYGPFSGQLNMACLEQTDHIIDIYVNRC